MVIHVIMKLTNEGRNNMSLEMKRYEFWVTLENKGPMKVAEEGRTLQEAKNIVESRFPTAKVMLA
jgi:hypothetical protein